MIRMSSWQIQVWDTPFGGWRKVLMVETVVAQSQSCLTFCNLMDHSAPGLLVLHHLPKPTQTHIHRISDAIHHLVLCRPLLLLPSIFPNIRVFSNESAVCIRWPKYWSFLPVNIQDWSPLGCTGWISLQSKGLSSIFSNTTVQKHQFFGSQPSLWSNSHIHMWLLVETEGGQISATVKRKTDRSC